MKKVPASLVAKAAVDAVGKGILYSAEDCQTFVERTIQRAGGSYVNYAGSNTIYREGVSRRAPLNSPEGKAMLMPGALLFIVAEDGGEPAHMRGDGLHNANHMGIYTGVKAAEVVHSSESRGGVFPSTLRNGWTHIAHSKHALYVGDNQEQDNAVISRPSQRILKIIKGKPLLKGDDVLKVQQRLVVLGYSLTPDGIYGYNTQAAVMDFQRSRGLLADGEVGDQTRAALLAAPQEGPVPAVPQELPAEACPPYSPHAHTLPEPRTLSAQDHYFLCVALRGARQALDNALRILEGNG